MNLKPYNKYKDADVEWLGDIPEHWKVKRVKDVAKTKSGTTPLSSNRAYYDGMYNWIRTTDLNNGFLYDTEYQITDLAIQDYNIKLIPINTVLIAMYGGFGTIGKNAFLKKASTINQSVCAVLPSRQLNPLYFFYFLKYFRFKWRLFADGTRKDPNINQDAVKNLFYISPPLTEQTKIANYLDQKTTAIDKKIKLLKAKIKHYEALKKSVINETVCRGLDKSVPMKDSGVEWIGEIPKHWEVKRFKDVISKYTTGGTPSTTKREFFEGDNTWVSIRDLTDSKYISNSKTKLTDEAIKEANILQTPKGSLLYSFKLSIGKMAFASDDLYTNEAILSIFPNRNVSLEYYYFMLSDFMLLAAKENIYGAKMLNQKLIANAFVLHPPKPEQIEIANYLDKKTGTIDSIVNNVKMQIKRLEELRKVLINDVVTGKVKIA